MASIQAQPMTGGKAYKLYTVYPYGEDTSKYIDLYMYTVVTQDERARTSTITTGLYVQTPEGVYVGPQADNGTSHLLNEPFDGFIPHFTGTWWLVSNRSITVQHDYSGNAGAFSLDYCWDAFEPPEIVFGVGLTLQMMPEYSAPAWTPSIAVEDLGDNTLSVEVGAIDYGHDPFDIGFTISLGYHKCTGVLSCYPGATASTTVSFDYLTDTIVYEALGQAYSGTVCGAVYTIDSNGNHNNTFMTFFDFTWHGNYLSTPKFFVESLESRKVIGTSEDYIVHWQPSYCVNVDNTDIYYEVTLLKKGLYGYEPFRTYTTYNTYYYWSPEHINAFGTGLYTIEVTATHDRSGNKIKSDSIVLGPIEVIQIETLPKVGNINVTDRCAAVPATYISTNGPIFMNVGSGNIAEITWEHVTALNNKVLDYFVEVYTTTELEKHLMFSGSVGDACQFFITADMFSELSWQGTDSIVVQVEIKARSVFDNDIYNSVENGQVSFEVRRTPCSYLKIHEGYSEPIYKRAYAFVRTAYKNYENIYLADVEGTILLSFDDMQLYTELDESSGIWTPADKIYLKANDNWCALSDDFCYEALVDDNGEVIRDINDEIIYVL